MLIPKLKPGFVKWVKEQASSPEMIKIMLESESEKLRYDSYAKSRRHVLTKEESQRGMEVLEHGSRGKSKKGLEMEERIAESEKSGTKPTSKWSDFKYKTSRSPDRSKVVPEGAKYHIQREQYIRTENTVRGIQITTPFIGTSLYGKTRSPTKMFGLPKKVVSQTPKLSPTQRLLKPGVQTTKAVVTQAPVETQRVINTDVIIELPKIIKCKKCNGKINKYGFQISKKGRIQKFQCTDCGSISTISSPDEPNSSEDKGVYASMI